jgi:DNA recombination protein RmuC
VRSLNEGNKKGTDTVYSVPLNADMVLILASVAAFMLGLVTGLIFWYRSKARLEKENTDLKIRLTAEEKDREAGTEKLGWVEKAETQMREAFKALATDALRTNSELMSAQARKDLIGIVQPVKENLNSLDSHIRELEKARQGAYQSLEQQIIDLQQTQSRLHESTITLSQALKSPTVRGRWGEIQLRRVVEMAGMLNHVSFDEQAATDLGRPDMITYLPNGGILPVDSKVPLGAYLSAVESIEEEKRKLHLAEHAKAMRSRIRDLAQKQYWEQFPSSPDFVVMFVPNEACLGAAFEADPSLLEHAIGKKVLICSPVTLVALLRTVAYGWQQKHLTENAARIAEEGRELYARLELFVRRFSEAGQAIGKAVERYNAAVGSLERRLMPAARRFQELGVSSEDLVGPAHIDGVASIPTKNEDEDKR